MLQKEKVWKEKLALAEEEHQKELAKMRKEVEQAEVDKQLISKSYESQLQMMSDALVEMQKKL